MECLVGSGWTLAVENMTCGGETFTEDIRRRIPEHASPTPGEKTPVPGAPDVAGEEQFAVRARSSVVVDSEQVPAGDVVVSATAFGGGQVAEERAP